MALKRAPDRLRHTHARPHPATARCPAGRSGAITVVFLVVGGLAFVVKSGLLNVALDVSLPLLLWAAAASISMIWRRPAAGRA